MFVPDPGAEPNCDASERLEHELHSGLDVASGNPMVHLRLPIRPLAGVAALLAALAWASPAPAQDQPRTAEAAAELRNLAVDLRLESIERIVDSIASRLERTDPAKAERVRAKRAATRAFAAAHLETAVEPMLSELFKEDLRARRLAAVDLKVDLHLFRAYDSAWRVKAIASNLMPVTTTGFAPPRSRGYPAEVRAIDVTAPHSMHDLHDYLADRFTRAALRRIVNDGRVVELHVGSEAEALSDLKNRRFNVLGEVRSPNGSYERLLLVESPQGELRYVVTGTIDGLDRVRHLSSLLRFAEGGGVANNRFEIVGDVEALKERSYRTMREGLERLGAGGSLAIVGFRATLRNELLERALARRGAEYLRDVLGSSPHEGLIRELERERGRASGNARRDIERALEAVRNDAKLAEGMGRAPADVFGKVAALKALIAAEKALVNLAKAHAASEVLSKLVADGKLRLPGGVSHKDATITRALESGALRADELRVNRNGRFETARLVNNYYGDAMADVTRALVESGHKTIAYFGTAGGTAAGVRVGDIHIPTEVYDWRNERATGSVRNGFVEYFEGRTSPLGDRLRVGTHLGNVYSPAVETMGWLEDVRTRGMHAVEVENSYLTREIDRYNRKVAAGERVKFFTSVIISDVPGSTATLGNSSSSTTYTFERMVDHYLEALKITDIEVQAKEAARFPNRPLANDERTARVLEVADRLVPRDLPRSSFLRDRIAGIIDVLDGNALNSLDTSKKLKPSDITGLSPEARAALEAEVRAPYTDAELVRSLERGNAVVSRLASELAARHPNASFDIRVGGGVEAGSYSPNRGLTVEVTGSPAARATAAELLPGIVSAVEGAPPVRAGAAGTDAIRFGRGEAFLVEPDPLVREGMSRAVTRRGMNMRGATVEYAGREHDVTNKPSNLFSRFELATVGPVASEAEIARFAERVARYGARVVRVPAGDPRLAGAQARTLVDAAGNTVILLPEGRPVSRYALIDELTHSIQLDRMRRALGGEAVSRLFTDAMRGDPVAIAKMLEWEIEAKRMVRLTLPADHPDRQLLEREIERLRRVLDPYLDVRNGNGSVNWERVRVKAREHGQGAASFLLGLFLKDLAKVIQTGDRAAIEVFFEGLATTEFWSHYGLFVVGAEAGTLAYTRFLQRFVKPSFVNTVLKSNVALATGMALPMIVHGQFDGRTFAINFTGLMLSSSAVKAGIAGLRWVVPLGRLERYAGLARALKLAGGVPGWIYHGVELAVVLYFAEEASARMTDWLDERAARTRVADAAGRVLALAATTRDPEDPALRAALEEAVGSYTAFRDRSLAPAIAATERFNAELERAGREATIAGTGTSRFNAIASRYGALTEHVSRYSERSDAEVDARLNAAVARFEADRDAALRRAYTDGLRRGAYDPVRDARAVSENRAQGYDDEAALYEAAAARATDPEVARLLRTWATTTREIRDRERALLDPSMANTRGITGELERGRTGQ